MSPPRMPNPGFGTLNTSASPVSVGSAPGAKRRKPGVPPNTPTVYQTEPSTGLGITAYGPDPGATRVSLAGSGGWPGSV